MKLSRTIIAVLAAALVTTVASAQDKPEQKGPPGGGRGHHGGGMRGLLPPELVEKLNLTPEQKSKYDELQKGFEKDAAQYRTDHQIDFEAMKKARESKDEAAMKKFGEQMKGMMDIRKGYMDKLEAVLNDQQKGTLKEAREKMMQRGGPRGEGKGPRPGGQKPAAQ